MHSVKVHAREEVPCVSDDLLIFCVTVVTLSKETTPMMKDTEVPDNTTLFIRVSVEHTTKIPAPYTGP